MYQNLKTCLDKKQMTIKDFAVFLNVTERTAHNKLNGVTSFSYPEADKINRFLFPEYAPSYLFATDESST